MARALHLFALLIALLLAPAAFAQERGPVVLAAASLQESLTEAANAWAAKGHAKPVLSFAASSALARQVMAGAPADLFLSADEEWMDAVAKAGLLRAGTRTTLLGNRLVLIAPASSKVRLTPARGFALARALGSGRLALADPDAVPAGKYAKAALTHLGVWASVAAKVAPAENVRAAMALVERGAAPLGIVYATDARASKAVRVVGVFPASSHPPIRYPVALLKASRSRDAAGFRAFLLSKQGRAIFVRHGFSAP
ncbi:molybdenum ABC transporter substrate-binding protein [Sphingopyxis sp. H038]|uniref:molybdate ABC transporter substrate-binding protein n=1 Tax=unclassified Sphingopyxis TaxID=2614943 RepID=UPI00073168E5|nr:MULTISPECIES: molybdate ABC transporter substrate-binding protein [unclassified Sphingopyxis]KTE00357.1 molybdenum ABC transporter substrate-binding protein [Sphingopyxis sp. H012]KTE06650.1 molybdenum ABC transporter substrate-binding protein [Sphingopyxis sp. H053]KTE08851.1 molybdenum ABC transporter substrate-binding protein [Sphingopyxis sp. H093]KTE28779.1 molybdenum ABC transporter substrate-binding protein [Sphingopyxis sp. H080]KTE32696.1 molybdenum ABC transporter substrate-bindin